MRSSVRSRLAPPSFLGLGAADAAAGRGDGVELGYLEHSLPRQTTCEGRKVRQVVPFGEDISDIVKRECGRWGRESVCPGGHVRQAYGDLIGDDRIAGLFVTVS